MMSDGTYQLHILKNIFVTHSEHVLKKDLVEIWLATLMFPNSNIAFIEIIPIVN